jgi:hypothetical protein
MVQLVLSLNVCKCAKIKKDKGQLSSLPVTQRAVDLIRHNGAGSSLMSFRIPSFRVTIPVLSSLILTACGGGGGGGSEDNSPDSGLATSGYRISHISFDYDNNGIEDASVSLTYEDGYLKQEVYQYTDDGTEDLYRFSSQYEDLLGRQTTTYFYDALGRIVQVVQRQYDNTDAQTYYSSEVYSYDSSSDPLAKPDKISVTSQQGAQTTFTQHEIDFEYENGLLMSYTRELESSDTTQALGSFTYDANGVLETALWASLSGTGYTQLGYAFSWENDLISQISIDVDPSNSTYEGVETYQYNANQFLESTALAFASTNSGTNATSTVEYDTDGLPFRQSWDYEDNGSIDGVMTFEVEAAACRYTYAWRAREKPNFAISENSALPPGTGFYRLRACVVPES